MPFTDPGKERAIIGCITAETFHLLPESSLVPPEVFSNDLYRLIYQSALGIRERGEHVYIGSVNDSLKATGLWENVQEALDKSKTISWECWSQDPDESLAFSPLGLADVLGKLRGFYHNREASALGRRLEAGEISIGAAAEALEALARLAHGSNGHFNWNTARSERRFDLNNTHDKPVPIFTLAGQAISTEGNLTSIFSQAKTGKSAVVGAIIGAAMAQEAGDFLGWGAILNVSEAALIHFDTELSRYDHDQVVLKAMRRASVAELPAWVHSYCLTDLNVKERLEALEAELERGQAAHNGVLAVLLDGVGDFVLDVNDAEECNNLVAHLHALAIKYKCVFIVVLHENPGADKSMTNKMRGHLGSQVERKSESNVRLVKDANDVTTQYTSKSRQASIPEAKGVKFAFNSQLGMHVTLGEAVESPTEDDRAVVAEMFQGVVGGMTWSECHRRIESLEGIKRDGARKRFKRYVRLGLITKKGEYYIQRYGATV